VSLPWGACPRSRETAILQQSEVHTSGGGFLREEEVLLACAAVDAGRPDGRVRGLLGEPLNWPYLEEVAVWHGVHPLVYRRLRDACPDLVPKPVMVRLRGAFTENARRNLFLTGELLRLLDLLRSQEIPAVAYKGPTLAALAHGDLTLRDFADNDVMIRQKDFGRARDLLVAEGYRPEFSLTPSQEAAYLRSRHALVFVDERGSIIELHWAIQPRYFSFALDPEMLWPRLQPVRLAGRIVPTFSREDLLQILTLHGAKHMWCRLEWICDVAALAGTSSGIDWDRVLEESRRLGARRMLLLGLWLARDLLSAEIPQSVLRLMEHEAAVAALGGRVRRRLFAGRQPGLLEGSAFFLRARERLGDRIRYCARLAATPYVRDWAVMQLPGATSSLYYLIRPFRMISRHAAAALRRE